MKKQVNKNIIKALFKADDALVKAVSELVDARNKIDSVVDVLELDRKLTDTK